MTFFQSLLDKLRPNELLQVEVLSFMPVVSKNGNDPTLESVLNHVLLPQYSQDSNNWCVIF